VAVRITADKVTHPGKIFRVTDDGERTYVLDAWTLETREVAGGTHFLTLGGHDSMHQFYLLESGLHVCVDEMDAVILELISEEIA
jgi:hypothetical protein